MRKPIFENKEEYKEFINKMSFVVPHNHEAKAEKLGYIRRNPVEEWEEMIKKYNNCNWDERQYILYGNIIKYFDDKLKLSNEAVQYLKIKNNSVDNCNLEIFKALKTEYELFEFLYNMGCLLLGSDIESKFKTAMDLKKNAIEKATGKKIEEIL